MSNLDRLISEVKGRKHETRIGVDIDNTLVHLPVIEYINLTYKTEYTEADFTDWNMNNFPKEIKEDVLNQFKNPEFMCRCRGYYGAYGKLRDLHASGVKLWGITRRAPNLINGTYAQIDKEFPGIFEDIFFVRPEESKVKYLTYINADILIDDWDVDDAVKAGFKVWLVTNEHTAYNHHMRSNTRLNQALAVRYVRL
jgi:uncharacterized HAD superfamily protein